MTFPKILSRLVLLSLTLPFLVGFVHPMRRGAVMCQVKTTSVIETTWTANSSTLQPLDSYLVSAYNLSDTTDSISGHDLTNNSSVTFDTGKYGDCAVTSGSNYLSVANHSGIQFGTGDFCVSMWVYSSQASGIGFFAISNTNEQGILAWVEGTTLKSFLGNGSWTQGITASAFTQNQWEHILMYRESGVYKIRVNDVEKISFAFAGSFDDTDADLCLGRWDFVPEYYTGKIDEVVIWKGTALNESARTALYNSGTGAFRK